jgi:hypothetical protein
MAGIYEPRGRALEYSPLALNLYNGCDHACSYCYNRRIYRSNWTADAKPMAWLTLDALQKTCEKYAGSLDQVLLSFVGDPYCAADERERWTRVALEALLHNRIPAAVLTKGGNRCLRDVDLFRAFGRSIMVGATITGMDDLESGAATNQHRCDVLDELARCGVPTWASFEPVIDPEKSLAWLAYVLDRGAVWMVKIGKCNQWGGCDDSKIDWAKFLANAVGICEESTVRYYIKDSLWIAAGRPEFVYVNHAVAMDDGHRNPRLFQSEPFGKVA